MKILKSCVFAFSILLSIASLEACKSKKAVVKSPPVTDTVAKEKPAPQAAPAQPAPAPEPAPAVAKPDYSFSNIQFEFNSATLKTDSYARLDHVVAEMKKDASVSFVLNGHSSLEGSAAHNMELSIDRANAVKLYLVNAGINGDNLTVKGYGETKPIADNSTEEGKALNRRVEIKVK